MLKKVTILSLLLFAASFAGISQTTDLLISEIVEGSSNNKYIEVYNGTGGNVNLNNYDIRIYFNGSGTVGSTINLSGTLATGNTYVIAHTSAVVWGGSPDLITGSCNFNGDDAIELFNTSTSAIIDLVGNIGCDPGSQWSSGGNSTQDNTIIRNATVCSGVTSDPGNSGCPFPTLASEWTQFAQNNVTDLGSHTETCSVSCTIAAEPTTNSSVLGFSNIDCFSMILNWTVGNGSNRIIVASIAPVTGTPTDQIVYTANSVFGAGSTIAAGEFVIYNGSGNSVTVSGLAQSTTYYFSIFEYNGSIVNCEENYLTTGMVVGNATTIACICPEITGILVDACGGSIEGINEFFTFQNGNSNLAIDSLTATFPSGGAFCNSGCGGQNWTTNPTYVTSLNATAGCGALFVEMDPIPANAQVIVFTGAVPTYNFDFTGLCGTGPYYAVFANNTSTSGRFANYNATCSNRTLTVDFGTNCSDAATYSRCLLSNNDGDYVTYDAAGNPTYQNDGCTPSAILPINLLYFKGNSLENGTNLLEWSTSSEINNDYFTIEHSKNAIDFNSIGTLSGAGNSNTQLFYQLTDDNPSSEVNYYRLKQTDFNGDYTYSEIIAINNNLSDINIYTATYFLIIESDKVDIEGTLEIYDITGRRVMQLKVSPNSKVNLSQLQNAVYIYRYILEKTILTDKFIIR
ncbi:MAG: lamin tail domain-containing protein [Flavobacteriales bacterium]|nr:lamin tail domain-containing protein [Flavobacteriales bacterium]